ncbi:pyridoxal phosphate-dependent enzyme, beta subunit [Aspergillus caelatus]|uniref:Pyridoxal phosphate-dependent enzyme, beta subunit n=1 Tax=Aspergillus caelatus TaxID=61420 RepID=A0A5N6ZYN1_9EURO|nr:pyridoxal phosphate-dependent enzyme, beta subunit [Aspergillus caelatus]KAE8362704.1 pyridoxal phosphate-dependent enzyme, beta subunit [Aspergillus caelatus]
MASQVELPAKDISGVVGRTPVFGLYHVVPPNCAKVLVKLELSNPTGTYKDRMAESILEEAERRGDLKPGMTIVAATDGITGSSLAFICAVKKYSLTVVSSNAFASEKFRTMEALGAKLDLIHSSSGITLDLISSMVCRAKELAQGDGYYLADQFHNKNICVGYETMSAELLRRFPEGIDAFCGAVGDAGMAMGVSEVLKSAWPEMLVVIPEPASSPTIIENHPETHDVDDKNIGFYPAHPDWKLCDEVCTVPEEEGREMCCRLAEEEKLLVETSAGLSVVAAIALAKRLGPGKQVVTVLVNTALNNINGLCT